MADLLDETVEFLLQFAKGIPRTGLPEPSLELENLLNYAPPFLTRVHSESTGPPTSPLDFYDLHIGVNHQLKRVVFLPTLAEDIASRLQKVSASMESRGLGPLPFNENTVFGGNWFLSGSRNGAGSDTEVDTPQSIGRFYSRTTAAACMPLASQWILHPKHDVYSNVLEYEQIFDTDRPERGFIADKFSLHVQGHNDIPANILRSLDRRTKLNLRYLEGKNLATWMFLELSPEGQSILTDMVNLEGEFIPVVPSTIGYTLSASKADTIPKGAKQPLFKLPSTDFRPPSVDYSGPQLDRIYPCGQDSSATLRREASRPLTANDLVQHAWTSAVRYDTTFIIFSTGNQERIGVRHRPSQTLYLSGLINPPTDSKPAYGEIHLGLYLAILEDVLDRLHQVKGRTSTGSAIGKRMRRDYISPSVRQSKRQKVNTLMTKMKASTMKNREVIMWESMSSKLLGFVYIQSSGFGSPIPSACARVQPCLSPMGIGKRHPENKREYSPTEALKLVLGPCFSEGAIGKLHTATIFVDLIDGTHSQVDVIVKLALIRRHRRRLRREYDMYKYLWERKITGILPIYGLFEDYNNLATLLVMGRGGISLWEREPDLYTVQELQVNVTPKERAMFIDILRGIHKAGICHRDIHPGNLVIDSNGNGYIYH